MWSVSIAYAKICMSYVGIPLPCVDPHARTILGWCSMKKFIENP